MAKLLPRVQYIMDKQLHIYILDVLQQSNAIGTMVDIKPAFEDELDTQEKRKNFKAQLDYLVSEKLIETNSKFEFLGWELLSGLYPLDNKKIEACLTGKWETYLAAKRSTTAKRAPVAISAPQPTPVAKLGLYTAPESVLPYPGVNANATEVKPQPAPQHGKNKPLPLNDKFLKEDDFLPFKTRNSPKPAAPPEKAPEEEVKPFDPEPFSEYISSYSPPKGQAPPIADTVPTEASIPIYTPPQPQTEQPKPAAPPRIAATVKRKYQDVEDAPIITARTAGLRPKPAPVAPPAEEPQAKEVPAPTRVVNLTSAAESTSVRTVAQQHVPDANAPVPPPSTNYAAIRFDTDNNPFAGLGTINLNNEDEKPKKPSAFTILKWTVISVLCIVIVLAIILYRRRYS